MRSTWRWCGSFSLYGAVLSHTDAAFAFREFTVQLKSREAKRGKAGPVQLIAEGPETLGGGQKVTVCYRGKEEMEIQRLGHSVLDIGNSRFVHGVPDMDKRAVGLRIEL